MAKYLAAKASWEAANACLQFHGGFGFAGEYDVERKFRETRLYQVAPISTNLILSLRGRARARPAALVLKTAATDDAAARRHHRRLARARDRGAVLHAPARRPRRARDQGRAARRRRLRARLRRARARPGLALRLDQPLQGKPDARPQAPARGRRCCSACWRRPTCWCRTWRRARPRAWACRYEALQRDASAADRLRHLRLRRRRPVPRQEGLRPADPERGGLPVGHRHAGRARARPAARSPTSPPACTPTPASWRRCCSAARPGEGSHIDVSMLETLAEWMSYPAVLRLRRRAAAAAHRRRARHASIPTARSRPATASTVMLGLQNEREWAGVLRRGAADSRRWRPTRASTANARAQRSTATSCARSSSTAFAALTAEQVVARLDAAQIANARMNDMADVWAHPQLTARERWREVARRPATIPALLPPGAPDSLRLPHGPGARRRPAHRRDPARTGLAATAEIAQTARAGRVPSSKNHRRS